MAKPIEIGLELEGQDAVEFEEYMKNPTYSEAAIDCMKKAMEMNDDYKFDNLIKENRELLAQNEKLKKQNDKTEEIQIKSEAFLLEIKKLKKENKKLRTSVRNFKHRCVKMTEEVKKLKAEKKQLQIEVMNNTYI